jgi:hypothetical protein
VIGDPIRFLFVDIPRLIDRELGLQAKSLLLAALFALPGQAGRAAACAFALQDVWPHTGRRAKHGLGCYAHRAMKGGVHVIQNAL